MGIVNFEKRDHNAIQSFKLKIITQDIGLKTIREKAKRFDAWVEKVKNNEIYLGAIEVITLKNKWIQVKRDEYQRL